MKRNKIEKSDEQWKNDLSPEQYYILRQKGTEPAWSGIYNNFKGEGIFYCSACESPLFDSKTKFESGSGWPSFYETLSAESVVELSDSSHGMIRTEVVCAGCDGHLGHVFPDGPEPTRLRYCINSISIVHKED